MKFDINQKIFADFEAFKSTLKQWKNNSEKIVFTNGCFDIIHHGHVDSLMKSSEYGTRLIVGLNSDESVRKLKGQGRPVLNVEARANMLAAFVFVDAVIIFREETPAKLISQILPDVLLKGKEYELHEIAGHETVLENGGIVETLDLVSGISTSELIDRIKNLE
ncbi:adenylyltransferase/cytidyltransferase family protein [Mariniphaga sp.]|uniref:adenylyltransferase/cytidyltransferase family protein n=1 Tax=Mariniphaga sp. TaxID=1954475 RepID=UPI003563C3AD